jgi:ankyrin repeat protein
MKRLTNRLLVGVLGVIFMGCLSASWAQSPDIGNVKKTQGKTEIVRPAGTNEECRSDALTHALVAGGGPNLMQRLFKQGPFRDTINCPSKYGLTYLMTAALNGHHEVVDILLQNGADPNVKVAEANCYNINAHSRIGNRYKKVFEKMGGVDSTCVGLSANDKEWIKGFTALHFACYAGEPQVVATLVAKGADISAKTAKGQTPIILAAKFGHMDVARALFQGGLHPREAIRESDDYKHSALEYASMAGKLYDFLRASGMSEEMVRWTEEQDKRVKLLQRPSGKGTKNSQRNVPAKPLFEKPKPSNDPILPK